MIELLIFISFLFLIIYLVGYFLFRSLLWVVEPLIKYFQEKEYGRFKANTEKTKKLENIDALYTLKDEEDFMVHTICRCPDCKRETTYYDPKIKRVRCTACGWVNRIDPEMTLEEFCRYYNPIIDKSEFTSNEKLRITIENFGRSIYLSKSLLLKAQKKPQKLERFNLWIYKDHIYSYKPKVENNL